ncbi:MAG: hypothetical protein QOK00_2561 [Thermoleophilaceae bacterium]|nr:hypothetical protein [Thermoleophilaceae bacterium]
MVLVVALVLVLAAPAFAHHEDTQLGPALPALPTSGNPADDGRFGPPFEEPGVGDVPTQDRCVVGTDGVTRCKPAAGSMSVLPNGRIVYWNALEGTERIERSLITDYGSVALNDQSRLLNLATDPPTWTVPSPSDAGANPGGYGNPLFPGGNGEPNNDGALFCSDHTFLPDGRIIATGGTAYYQDPEIADTGIGVVELEGLRATRIYDPATNRWSQTGSMNVGRWYPSLVSLGNGKEFVASGVEKLVKPVYPDHPEDSFTNVRKTETTTRPPGSGPTTAPTRSARCRCSRACTCCPMATSTTTRPGSRSTRSARPTTRRSGTSRPPTTRRPDAGRTWASPGSRAARSRTCSTSTSASRSPTCRSSASPGAARASRSPASAAPRSR